MNRLITSSIIASCIVSSVCFAQKDDSYLQIKGSDTLVNAAQMLAEQFMEDSPEAYIAVTGGGSGVGIASLINQTADIATASREMKQKEIDSAKANGVNPVETVIAYDGIALIVNKNNPVEKLTIQQLHDIYTGRITNWKELGGTDMKITLLSREVNSGTHVYFKEEVVQLADKNNKEEFTPGVLLMPSSQAIVEETTQNTGAIGYLGMGYMSDKTKTIKISKDGTTYAVPDINDVLAKTYPLARPLYFYTNNTPNKNIKAFIEFTLSMKGQKVISEAGFVPLTK